MTDIPPSQSPTPPPRPPDPVRELAELLLLMRVQTHQTDIALRRVENNRLNLLVVHALAAIGIGTLFMLSADALRGPAWSFISYLPGFPITFGLPLTAAGLLLLPATLARQKLLERIGLYLIYFWYLALAIGFFVPSFKWVWAATGPLLAGDPLPPGQPGLYAWVVYLHLAVIMRVHLWTLSRLSKYEKAQEKARKAAEEGGQAT